MILTSLVDVATVKPSVEIADIFRLYFDECLQTHHCTPEEFAAASAIMKCRTAAMGGHVRCCDSCGHLQIAYNSCNDRNCPKCGAFEKAQWVANQAARLIPVPHFQVVFTVDHLSPPEWKPLVFSYGEETKPTKSGIYIHRTFVPRVY
ncbi:MAG: transposase zinc-binding domain-containing protein [Caldilineaceae bacterium]